MFQMTLNITGIMLEGLKNIFQTKFPRWLSNGLNRHFFHCSSELVFLKWKKNSSNYIDITDLVSSSTITKCCEF